MNNITEEQINTIVDKAVSTVGEIVTEEYIQVLIDLSELTKKCPELKGEERSIVIFGLCQRACGMVVKESLKELFCNK